MGGPSRLGSPATPAGPSTRGSALRRRTRCAQADRGVLHRCSIDEADKNVTRQKRAQQLIDELKARGKWPAKPDLKAWYGAKRARWQNPQTGEFLRAVMLPDDPELLTRHEVLSAPPDVLITNYSMLEYMLMRPLERPGLRA